MISGQSIYIKATLLTSITPGMVCSVAVKLSDDLLTWHLLISSFGLLNMSLCFLISLLFVISSVERVLSRPNTGSWAVDLLILWPMDRAERHQSSMQLLARVFLMRCHCSIWDYKYNTIEAKFHAWPSNTSDQVLLVLQWQTAIVTVALIVLSTWYYTAWYSWYRCSRIAELPISVTVMFNDFHSGKL